MADFRIEGIVDLDISPLLRDLEQVDRALRDTDNKVNKLSRSLDKLSAKTIDIEFEIHGGEEVAALNEMVEALDGKTISIDVDIESASDELNYLDEQIDRMDGRDIDIDVDVDRDPIDGLTDSVNNANRSLSGAVNGGVGRAGLIGSIALLATALVPVGVTAAGVGGGLVSAFATAGVGIAAFGALAIPTIKKVIEGNEELKKAAEEVANADSYEKLQKALKKQKEVLAGLSPETQKAIKELRGLQTAWEKAAQALAPQTLEAFSGAMRIANLLIGEAIPIARDAAAGILHLITLAERGVKGDNWQKFFDYMSENAGFFITQWGGAIGNFITGVANMIVAFDPVAKFVSEGFLDMSESFLKWSENLDKNQSWKNFMDYTIENGPKIWKTIKDIVLGLVALGKAIEPLGKQVLNAIRQFFDMAKSLREANPQVFDMAVKIGLLMAVLSPFAGVLATLLKPLIAVGVWFASGIAGFIATVAGSFTIFGVSIAAIAGPIGIVVAALVGIGLVLALTNTKTSEAAGMWSSLRGVWDTTKQTALEIWANLQKLYTLLQDTGAIENFQVGITLLADALRDLMPIIGPLAIILGVSLVTALYATSLAFRTFGEVVQFVAGIIGVFVRAIVAVFQWMFDVLVGHSIIPDLVNSIIRWFQKLGNWFKQFWEGPKKAVLDAWEKIRSTTASKLESIRSTISSKLESARTTVSSKLESIKGFFSSKFESARTFVSNKLESIRSTISSKLESARSTVASKLESVRSTFASKLEAARSAVSTKIDQVVSIFSGLWGRISGAISNIDLSAAGSRIVGTLIAGIRSRIGDVVSAASALGQAIKDRLPGSPVKYGPLTSWNDGSPGKELVGLIIKGLQNKQSSLQRAMANLASYINQTTLSVPALAGGGSVRVSGVQSSGPTDDYRRPPPGPGAGGGIGVYIAPGAVQVNGGGDGARTGQQILTKLTRLARFGQFQGPSGTNK